MNKLRYLHYVCFTTLTMFLMPTVAFASPGGIGQVAGNLMGPVGLLSEFVYTACFGIGGAFLFATIIKYIEHRRSPTMVPISTVVFLFISGAVLLLLPFLSYLLTGVSPYSLLK